MYDPHVRPLILQQPKPGPYVAEIKDSTQFYGNRVIKEFKEKYVHSVVYDERD